MAVAGRWDRIEALFDEAALLPAEERAAFLARACGDDPEMRGEVESLLAADEKAAGFLGRPVASAAAPPAPPPSLVGQRVGHYRVEARLGEGGMSTVYLAVRADDAYQQQVALKVLGYGAERADLAARFRAERQILASLDHPGIARLLDTGVSPAGQPYLVLEYIEGTRIDHYADERGLKPRARIDLVQQVLAAVEHAHAHQVVHRDIKPSNILVTNDGAAKLLDFGIAKMVSPDGSLGSAPLTAGSARVLTPEYAAPEQASGAAVSPATDVYAVGVLLYLLLSGTHPTAEGRRGAGEVIAALFEVQPKPLGLGGLDEVLEKSLRKNPDERYQSAKEMADALGP